MAAKFYLGIDPGKSGGWGLLCADGTVRACGKRADWGHLRQQSPLITGAAIERQGVWAGDKAGGKIFHIKTLLIDYGWWTGLMDAWRIAWRDVASQTWRAHHKLLGKAAQYPGPVQKAQVLWPELANLLKKHHDGVAVGLLLAQWLLDNDPA